MVRNSLFVGFLTFALCVVFAFVWYLNTVQKYSDHPSLIEADGIVVLTGGYARLTAAAALLEQGLGKRLLVSGVNENTSPAALKQALGLDDAQFNCCVDIDRLALDTFGNAREVANWAQEHGYGSLLVVTNDYHMPRSLLLLKEALDGVLLFPAAVGHEEADHETIEVKIDRLRVQSIEFVKYMGVLVRTLF